MRRVTTVAGLLVAGLGPTWATAQAKGAGQCYEVKLGPWAPPLALGADTAFTIPPHRFSVDAAADSALGRGAYAVRALAGAAGPVHSRGRWAVVRADSVEVLFTTGFSGVVLHIHRDGAVWRGSASTFWDFPRPEQTALVSLASTACPTHDGLGR
jgi:hypothetical protein